MTGTEWDSTGLNLEGNPLNYASLHTYIPAMQARGIEVTFDPRTPTTLTKRLGDVQQAKPGEALAIPLVVEVKDEKGVPFSGVPVTFTVTAGGGKVRSTKTVSDTTGRAQTTLTLGHKLGTNTVRVTAAEIQQPVIFTATATDNPPPIFSKPTTFFIAENTTAIGTAKATDVDRQDRVTGYSISPTAGEDSAKFSITPTGVLRFKTAPDYERPTTAARTNEYIVLVSATGGTGKRARTGTQPFIITVTDVDEPPATPTAPTVIPATPTSLIVSWAASVNTGPPLTYQVRYRLGNTGRFTNGNYNGAATNFTLNDLLRGKRYQVQVRAKNAEGTSAWSPSGTGVPQVSQPINFPDTAFRMKIAGTLNKASNAPITAVDMLALTKLDAPNANIQDLTGLEHAHNLSELNLGGKFISGKGWVNSNAISDFSPLLGLTQLRDLNLSNNAISDLSLLSGLTQLTVLDFSNNAISDLSPLSGLTQLTVLRLSYNTISDVSPLAGLIQVKQLILYGNTLSDVSPLLELPQLVGSESWRGLFLQGNPLNYASLHTHIPAMQARGIEVRFDPRTPTTLVKISGAAQQSIVNTALPLPFVVEVRDQQNRVFAGVPVTFRITTGGGRLSTTTMETDAAGRAETHLTLGRTPGKNIVRVTATEVSQPAEFTAIGTHLTAPVAIPDTNLRTRITEALGKAQGYSITVADMLQLTELTANNANILDLTGLQQASNLTTLALDNNNISDISLLAGLPQLTWLSLNDNNISDVAPLTALTHLQILSMDNNNLSDVAPLGELPRLKTLSLDNNAILDVAALEALTHLKTLRLRGNLLSYPALHTSVPAIQAGGATVAVDARAPTTLIKVSGTHGVAGTALRLIVEVQDEQGFGFAGVPVTFSVIAGGGHLSTANVITDRTGRARTTFTLGTTPGKNTVRAAATDAPRPVNFTLTAVDANSHITIRDTNLRAKIAETLGKARDVQLTAADMLALTRLDVPNANIQDLIGLEHAHNLEYLNLGREYIQGKGYVNTNAISNFSQLEGLIQLTGLNLDSNAISDVMQLANLTQLTSLSLRDTGISDVRPLAKLTRLTSLYLSGPTISDISALAGLTRLHLLQIGNTSVSDISVLAGLRELTTLYLDYNAIANVEPLAALTQLSTLRLLGNAVTDVSPLAGLIQLIQLQLGGNSLADVSALAGLIRLKYLYLSNTAVSDVAPLKALTQLTVLDLRYNTISDVSPLVGLNLTGTEWNSTGLYLEGNPLNYASLHTHIPAMQARGIEVTFDPRTYPALDIISGTGQQTAGSDTLANPFVVAAIDARGTPMRDVAVSFAVIEGAGQLTATTATTDARGRAETALTVGPNPGRHRVRVTAPTLRSSVTFIAIATAPAARLAADVNGDGVVNIQDLVLVSANFGQTGQNAADVNRDGAVNIQDLVLVAGEFGAEAAAPSAWQRISGRVPSRATVEQWLIQAYHLSLTDVRSQRGIFLLERLLAALVPKETALLANYPNPFNPETWIPYQLAKPAEVTLTIYAVDGRMVRQLTLGHQPAGMYHNKKRAAYWDGRNAQGEKVASGVYFYTLSAGEFSATRKLLIRK